MTTYLSTMAQFFNDIEKWNRSIEEMFEFIAEISWITLLHNDNMNNNRTDTLIRFYLFNSYTMYLNILYRTLYSATQINNIFYSILKAQLRENLIRHRFKRFENHHEAWQHFNFLGFRDTVHYPLSRYQACATIIRNQIIQIQAYRDIFQDELERAFIFYETTQFVENTIESRQAHMQSIHFSRSIIAVSDDLQEFRNQQRIFYFELMEMAFAFDNR